MRALGAIALAISGAIGLVLGAAAFDDPRDAPVRAAVTACEGKRPLLPTLYYELRSGAFPEQDGPDVAVHVPAGFDATRRPSAVVYFHGWNGCAGVSMADDDGPCSDGGEPRHGSALARQIDESGVNALLVAVELRSDAPTGEPGDLAQPGGLRALLEELFVEHLAEPLGCTLAVDRLDRVVIVAHSGGYQAAASVLARGDLPQISEVDLLDGFYGADAVFERWVLDAAARFDGSRRFVDLYTCCGGTLERSRKLADLVRSSEGRAAISVMYDDDGDGPLTRQALRFPIVLKRVPEAHGDVPRGRFRALLEASKIAPR
jgi:hypothetical protein